MSKKDEALKLALEALEEIHPGNMTPMAEGNWNKAIAAIREALAEQPAQQDQGMCGYDETTGNCTNSPCCYTSPPASKSWVGLTPKEKKEIERQSVYVEGAIRHTEAKLKEKNT